jgi:hypothetical protein
MFKLVDLKWRTLALLEKQKAQSFMCRAVDFFFQKNIKKYIIAQKWSNFLKN